MKILCTYFCDSSTALGLLHVQILTLAVPRLHWFRRIFHPNLVAETPHLSRGNAHFAKPLQEVVEPQDLPPHQEYHRADGLGAQRDCAQAAAHTSRPPREFGLSGGLICVFRGIVRGQ